MRGIYAWANSEAAERAGVPQGLPNPAVGLDRHEEISRDVHLPREKIRAFLAQLPEDCRPAARLALATGVRKGNFFGAARGQMHGTLWTIPAGEMKSGRLHELPLTDGLARLIPLEVSPQRFADAIRAAGAAAGVAGLRIHDLRRSCATLAAELGAEQSAIDCLLGHARPGVSGIYNRARMLAAVGELIAKLDAEICGEPEAQRLRAVQ
jgi:integrase